MVVCGRCEKPSCPSSLTECGDTCTECGARGKGIHAPTVKGECSKLHSADEHITVLKTAAREELSNNLPEQRHTAEEKIITQTPEAELAEVHRNCDVDPCEVQPQER